MQSIWNYNLITFKNIMSAFWKAALTVGGLAAIGAFVFWSLYKDWLQLPIFSQMSPEQTFSLMKVFLWLTFGVFILCAVVYLVLSLRNPKKNEDNSHIFNLHEAWNGVNEIDPNNVIGPDVTNANRAMQITATSWLKGLVPKKIIIENHFEDFDILYNALKNSQAIVPGFEKQGRTCDSFITNEMDKAYTSMKQYNQKATK